ncbi:alpha/beta fold hydrolase [Streptomyces sp. NPDC007904]|jgi:pimeloyl-ACP methyl ester carboxylesterase|uniref:alpha/beta fold hydrolase n=1 Tax=Streptomyces sp. NPDC007904 TaxID=3364787 RepID=UPI0036EAEC7D
MTTSVDIPRIPVSARTAHRFIEVDGVEVFYRESLPERSDAPVLLLLHGFPSASHQFRRLIDSLGRHYRLIAPDYPGFGHTRAPDDFTYSFERLTDVVEQFTERLGLTRYAMYLFDFGAPVGFRLALRHPERVAGLVVQNGNAHPEGLSDAARAFTALTPETPGAESTILNLFTLAEDDRAHSTRAAPPIRHWSPRRAGCWTSTSWTSPAASRPNSPSPTTTGATSPPIPPGRRGCASTARRR